MVVQAAQPMPTLQETRQDTAPQKAQADNSFSDLISQATSKSQPEKSAPDAQGKEVKTQKKAEQPEAQQAPVIQNSQTSVSETALTALWIPPQAQAGVVVQKPEVQPSLAHAVVTEVTVTVAPTQGQSAQVLTGNDTTANIAKTAQVQPEIPLMKLDEPNAPVALYEESVLNTTQTPQQSNEPKPSTQLSTPDALQIKEVASEPKPVSETANFTVTAKKPFAQESQQAQGTQVVQQQEAQSVQQQETVAKENAQIDFKVAEHVGNETAETSKKADMTKDEKLPIEKAIDTSVKTSQTDFAHEVKAASRSTQSTSRSEIIDQVMSQINSKFDAKTSEFSFDLNPATLGKVSVKMVVENGMLVVEIAASSARTQSILASNAGEIKAILQQSSQQQPQLADISQNAEPHDYLNERNHNGQNRQGEGQQRENDSANENRQPSASDFLSVMQLVSSAKITEGW